MEISRRTVQRWLKQGVIRNHAGKVSLEEIEVAALERTLPTSGTYRPGRRLRYKPSINRKLKLDMQTRAANARSQGYYVPRAVEALENLSGKNLNEVISHGFILGLRRFGIIPDAVAEFMAVSSTQTMPSHPPPSPVPGNAEK